jgi:hypothetical protein
MKIKIIPETDSEKEEFRQKFGTDKIEHKGIREYFIFGNNVADRGDVADFHEWVGSYLYLMYSLNYFYELINDERRSSLVAAPLVTQKFSPTILGGTPVENGENINIQKNAEKFE